MIILEENDFEISKLLNIIKCPENIEDAEECATLKFCKNCWNCISEYYNLNIKFGNVKIK